MIEAACTRSCRIIDATDQPHGSASWALRLSAEVLTRMPNRADDLNRIAPYDLVNALCPGCNFRSRADPLVTATFVKLGVRTIGSSTYRESR
jgi:hypothetical protein